MHVPFLRSAPLALLALAATAAPASAADLLSRTVTATGSTTRICHEGLAAGTGIAQRELRMAPLSGTVSAVLSGASGDWDVALFDKATGKAVAGAAGFGAAEVATGFAGGNRRLVLQTCRRSGSGSARVLVRSEVVPSAGLESTPSLVKVTVADAAGKTRLGSLGFDLTEHAGRDYVEVVAYGAKDLARLSDLGFTFTTVVEDLVKQDVLRATADRLGARKAATRAGGPSLRAAGDTMPSGRTEYRRLADYEADMKKLVEQNPGLVKPIVLKNKTIEGRAVNGIEITRDVNVVNDGKPVFLQMGVHHAREWPSGEHAMEWAFELVNGIKAGDPQFSKLGGQVRTIVVPVVNVDGFNVSREAPVDLANNPEYQQVSDAGLGLGSTAAYLVDPANNYKRRNCRLVPGVASIPAGACALPAFRLSGVDPNRNYGGLWGGPGASALPAYDTYRGAGPFSEPETQNVRALVSERQVTTLITNHTFSNLVLRAPGVRAQGQPVDEPAMKDLGARMAAKNGYANQPSYMLYDTTGGTEDWSYGTAGGYGYTFEIGPDVANDAGGGFHPAFNFTVGQYNRGSNDGGGNKAAYRLAMENAADPVHHSRITGSAPAGVTLKVTKDVVTETSPVEPLQTDPPVNGVDIPSPAGDKIRFPDTLGSSLDVTRTGAFSMAVNPSTRPVSDQSTLEGVANAATREETFTPKAQTEPDPNGGGAEGTFEDVPFTVTEADAAKGLRVLLTHDSPLDDYDLTLSYRENGVLKEVGRSGNPIGTDEEILIEDPPVGEYVLRVKNYLAFSSWKVTVSRLRQGADTVRPRKATESWTLTCEVAGRVLGSQKVEVDRGRAAEVKEPCGANAAAVVASVTGKAAKPRCGSSAGFKAVALHVLGRRKVRFAFARTVANPVTIDVFQAATARRPLANRRVARFTKLSTSRTFAPRTLADGTYFARYAVKGARTRVDERRITFAVRGGKVTRRKAHHQAESCGLLGSAKLESPAFGGTTRTPLRIALRTARRADVTVLVKRGSRVAKRFTLKGVAGLKTRRLSVPSSALSAKGDWTVSITAVAGRARGTAALVSKRL
ncbi:MAG: cpt [Solirubrobacterales bacterium]|nr:cpt [Solirubrobacterales bacterium]